ncbi:hypothetical protein CAPTEDRAFT_224013 [Capitella teleta]|uniref:Acyl-CoA thioesterase n=1 Tax=Capitella teleta TaxID=283909 RepID=R7UF08_CAPTE|nr:hypothetical protein CAPTEDRAFT_224013 [Capitella teleta]|eukprot:ELU04800.1 hypothetical protein CAPTEDRAFT_224013 [Capitella teleta]
MSRIFKPEVTARLARLANCPMVHGDGYLLRAKLPGFSNDDFNRAAYPSLFKLGRVVETERPLFFRYPEHTFRRFLSKHEEVMMIGNHSTISKSLYHKASFDLPMTLAMSTLHIGGTSFDVKLSLTEDSTGDEFISTIRRIVCVNMETKKSCAVPAAMKEFFIETGIVSNVSKPTFEPFGPLSPPADCFTYKLIVRHDDMDILFHANNAVYTKFAENCAAAATNAGFYRHFRDDICFYLVHKSSVIHVGESFAGDELEVITWQDDVDHNLLYFVTTKNGKDLCYHKFMFFPSE